MTNLKKIIFALSLIAPVLFTGCWSGDIGDLAVAKIDGIKSSTTTDTTGSTVDNRYHFVAVGDGGAIWISKDGLTWEDKSVGGANLNGVTWGNDKFVAVGASDRVVTSPDGITWTEANTGTNTLRTVIYAYGKYVATGDQISSAYHNIFTSSDDGVTWSKTTGASGTTLYSIAYGNGNFAAVGPTFGGLFINMEYSSDNGSTWTFLSADGNTISFWAVVFANSSFLAIGELDKVYQSSSGIDGWTPIVISTGNLPPSPRAIAYGNGIYIAAGFETGPIAVLSSSTLLTAWNYNSLSIAAECRGVAFGNGKFVVVGQNGLIVNTPDGTSSNWSGSTGIAGTANLNAIAYRP